MSYESLQSKKNTGFTLIEVLLVIAILAILAAVVIVAINPAKQFASARDAQRQSDVYSILNALYQYSLDHESTFPGDITTQSLEVCRTDSDSCIGKYDLSSLTDNEAYLIAIPIDPYCAIDAVNCENGETGYFVSKTDNGRIVVTSGDAETRSISVSK